MKLNTQRVYSDLGISAGWTSPTLDVVEVKQDHAKAIFDHLVKLGHKFTMKWEAFNYALDHGWVRWWVIESELLVHCKEDKKQFISKMMKDVFPEFDAATIVTSPTRTKPEGTERIWRAS